MSSTAHLDQDALANLTPEERAAFDESEYTPEELAAMQKLAAGAPDDKPNDDDDDGDPNEILDADGKPVTVIPATDPAKTDADPAPAATTAPAATEAPADKPVVYKASLPEDFDAKVKDVNDRVAALRTQFKAGEIDFDSYEEQAGALNQERDALTMARAKAEISQEMTQQNAEAQWNSAIQRLFANAAKPENGGIDYTKDNDRNAELDQFVRVLAANPAHADKPMDWFLNEGHRRVMALNGKSVQAPAAGQPTATAPAKPAVQDRTPPTPPKTIAHIPGGDGPGDVGGEFDHLDALDGNDLEAAIAKMTPAQREKWSRGK